MDVDPDGDLSDLDADVDPDADAVDGRSERTVSIDQTDEDDNPSYRNVRCASVVLPVVARCMLPLRPWSSAAECARGCAGSTSAHLQWSIADRQSGQ